MQIDSNLVKFPTTANMLRIDGTGEPTSPVSLLESLASDHIRKVQGGLEDGTTAQNPLLTSNPLLNLLPRKMQDVNLNKENVDLDAGSVKNPFSAIKNPLLSTPNPLLGDIRKSVTELNSPISGNGMMESSHRDQPPSSLPKNPLLGCGLTKPNGFCSNPLLAGQNCLTMAPPKVPLLAPNGVSTGNPLLSKLAAPILPMPSIMLGTTPPLPSAVSQPQWPNVQKSIPVDHQGKVKEPTTATTAPKLMSHSKPPLARFKPKSKPTYEFGIVEIKTHRHEEAISFPVPYDNVQVDPSLIKTTPSNIGQRFLQRKPSRVTNPNVSPSHFHVWSIISTAYPEEIFKFDTPSPDAMVGTAAEFVGMRVTTTEQLLAAGTEMETSETREDFDSLGNSSHSEAKNLSSSTPSASGTKRRSTNQAKSTKKKSHNANATNHQTKSKKTETKRLERKRSKNK